MSFFSHHVFCCTNRRDDSSSRGSCAQKGSEELRDYMKKQMKVLGIPSSRVNAAGCLDRCEKGPVMVIYPAGIWYHYETKADIDEILNEQIIGGRVVERLRLADTMAQPK